MAKVRTLSEIKGCIIVEENNERKTLTKEKLKWIIKRLSYIFQMKRKGITELSVYISKKKEKIIIDKDVVAVMEIIDEIVDNEQIEWVKQVFKNIKMGRHDVFIIMECPVERTKYYEMKKEFIDKIYQCCIFKGLVEYEDILNASIG